MAVPRYGDSHDLVRGLLDGDEQAAVALFDEYAPLVERTILRITGSHGELSDVAQDAFMSALRTLPKLRDPQALPKWMQQVAIRTAVDWMRRRKRQRWLKIVDPDELVDRPEPSVGSNQRDILEAAYTVLASLSAVHRAVFALRHFEGMQLDEIAEACGFSLATAKRRLAHADRRFKVLAKKDPTLRKFVLDEEEEDGS